MSDILSSIMVSIMDLTFLMFFVVYSTLINSEEGGNLWVIFSICQEYVPDICNL